jgi:hypothetical protein
VVRWLDQHVSANRPYDMPDRERTEGSRFNPYHVSTTAQIATWRGEGDLWEVRQSSRKLTVEVTCQDPHIETLIGLKFSQ